MYEITDARTQEFATWIGIPRNIVKIFTSRIPQKVIKTTATGKKITIDGDTIIYSTLNDLYELRGQLSVDFKREEKIRNKYTALVEKVKYDPTINVKVPCFERFVVSEFLSPYMPRTKKVTVDDLIPEEVAILYNWIRF